MPGTPPSGDLAIPGATSVLVLGGTSEGRAVARALAGELERRVVTSLAGLTTNPRLPPGEVRVGGFGGADGLAAYLREQAIAGVVDATHPFAATMARNAEAGCRKAGVKLLRLERPAWRPIPGDDWVEVDDWPEAAELVGRNARRVLLAVGRREIGPFAAIGQVWFLVRAVEAPNPMPPFRQIEILLSRGPFTLDGERRLLATHRIDTVVCRNSGGSAAAAKLIAARELGLRVVMKRRPPRPDVPTVASVDEAVAWVRSLSAR
jgi:precorrin-6A/cobalt-precorrin-6A reductase